jgi:hypothetical protein
VADARDVRVIDTSSIIEVRQRFGRSNERKVFSALTSLIKKGELIWPPEVTHEVEAALIADSAVRWVKANREIAERSAKLETVKSVLFQAPTLIDSNATREQADPYVVALALDVASGDLFPPKVTVVTEDRRDKPGKLSLATAAGLLGLPTVPLHALIASIGVET